MSYKDTVRSIVELPWRDLSTPSLIDLMLLSYCAAREFSASLRIALRIYPDNPSLAQMAKEELQTTNLQFGSYTGPGDHADFLHHLIATHGIETRAYIKKATENYRTAVSTMSDELRAMSIFSREQELSSIFRAILEAKGWESHPALLAFKYFLERHIELDSAEGGHADMVSAMEVTEEVDFFYKVRRRLYQPLFPQFVLE